MPSPHGAVPIASPVPPLHTFGATTSTCPGHPAASGLFCSCHGLCLQRSGWEIASSVGSGHAQPGMTVWDVSSHSHVTPLHYISDLLL